MNFETFTELIRISKMILEIKFEYGY
jgi:hypothetical protein